MSKRQTKKAPKLAHVYLQRQPFPHYLVLLGYMVSVVEHSMLIHSALKGHLLYKVFLN